MIAEILTIGLLNSSLTAMASESVPAAPKISCEIRLQSWCITNFDGKISMDDNGSQRIWHLQDRLYMANGPLVIVEDKNCVYPDTSLPKVSHHKIEREDVIDVAINYIDKCGIHIKYNSEPKGNNSYIQRIKYGILLCKNNLCEDQLVNFFDPES